MRLRLIKFFVIFTIFTSCNTGMVKTEKAESVFFFDFEPLAATINKSFEYNISKEDLKYYDKNLQNFFETKFDGQKLALNTPSKLLDINVELTKSFKILEKNIYCREYLQTVEYDMEVISHTGVACRKKENDWQNIVKFKS